MSSVRTIVYPRRASWIVLLVATSPIWAFGIYCAAQSLPLEAVVSLAFAGALVGYNASMRLVIDDHCIVFRRYGLPVWSVPIEAANFRSAKIGDLKNLPGYSVECAGVQIGYLLSSWFPSQAIRDVILLSDAQR